MLLPLSSSVSAWLLLCAVLTQTNLLTSLGNYRAINSASCWSIYLLLIYRFHDTFYWCGHTSGMTVIHAFCLTLRQNTNNWCPSPSQQGPHLCHRCYRNSVLLWSPECIACLGLWTHLAGVPGVHEGLQHSPRAKGGLRDGAAHHIPQPHSCPKTWSTEFQRMEKKKRERFGDSIIQIFPDCKLTYLHRMNKLIIC